jgi:hypothetical protein
VPRQSGAAGFEETERIGRITTLAGSVVAAICLTLAAAIVVHYPFAPWIFGIILVLYALALWRWPALWLAVIPAVLPSFDLTPGQAGHRSASQICSCLSRSGSWRCERLRD